MPIGTTPSGTVGEFSTYTPIYSQTLTSTATSITFSNIPTTYTDLVLSISIIPTGSGLSPQIRFNGDSGANYSYTTIYGNGTSALGARGSGNNTTYLYYANSPTLSVPAQYNLEFPNYSNATNHKTALYRLSVVGIESTAQVVLWRNTSPITSMEIFTSASSFAAGSTFTIYGIKAAAPAPKATGGDLVYTDNTYWYHIFNNSGIFDVKTAMNVDYLVVAGGGGGGSADGVNDAAAGGGGAGGFRTGSGISVSAQSYTITVGAGGAGSTIRTSAGTNGGNSQFATISSTGGGGGGSGGSNNGLSGGSGGGSRGYSGTGGSGNAGGYSPVEGYAGGSATTTKDSGSGGGGASAAGNQASTTSFGGTGGAGTASSITGTSITYAGGGGGGSYNTNNTASGGSGGGGKGGGGSNPGGTNPTNGTANLGGGGGGGYANANYVGSDGANGGSGVVVVRYAV